MDLLMDTTPKCGLIVKSIGVRIRKERGEFHIYRGNSGQFVGIPKINPSSNPNHRSREPMAILDVIYNY